MKKVLTFLALAFCAISAKAAGTYVLVDVSAYNGFAPTPTTLTGGPIPFGGTAVVDGAGNVTVTNLQHSWVNVNSTYNYTNGTWSTTVGGTSITNTATCVESAGSPCSGALSGLAALGNSSVWDNVSNNDGTPAGVCNLANLLNGPGGSCAGVSIVENPGVSLVITEQSEFAIATIASGFVYTFAVVPVPAAVWLFGSAIGLLGFVRRRMNLAA